MLCRNCAREIPDNSVFCNWCGERQIKERRIFGGENEAAEYSVVHRLYQIY